MTEPESPPTEPPVPQMVPAEQYQADMIAVYGSLLEMTEIACDAIGVMSGALNKGMHASRPEVEQGVKSLVERLTKARTEFTQKWTPAEEKKTETTEQP